VTDEKLSRSEKERSEAERSFGSVEKDNQDMLNQIDELQNRLADTEEKAERK
jgi:peptidoglycan hydrolase CwlO-like protein